MDSSSSGGLEPPLASGAYRRQERDSAASVADYGCVSDLRQQLRAVQGATTGILLLALYFMAGSVQSECLGRCQHSCCRHAGIAAGAPAPHCDLMTPDAGARTIRGHCHHHLESAATTIPPLDASLVAGLDSPQVSDLQRGSMTLGLVGRNRSLDPPPPRLA